MIVAGKAAAMGIKNVPGGMRRNDNQSVFIEEAMTHHETPGNVAAERRTSIIVPRERL